MGIDKCWYGLSGNHRCTGKGWHRKQAPHCLKSSQRRIPVVRLALHCVPVTEGRSGKHSWVMEMLLWDAMGGSGMCWEQGGWARGGGGQLASVARVTGQQILREVRLKLVLLFTDPITKCRPSVFLGFFMWFVLYCAHHCARGTEVFLLSFLRYQGVQIVSVTLRVWVRPVQQHRVQHRFSVVPCCAAFEAEKVFVLFL